MSSTPGESHSRHDDRSGIDPTTEDRGTEGHRATGEGGPETGAADETMLNACAPGVLVVNIDNGFGAAVAAARIVRSVSG